MSKQLRKAWSLFLTLALTAALAVPAQAAGLRLTWDKRGSNVEFTLRGLGEQSVYGLQLELTVEGSYSSASFAPADAEAYAECRASASDRSTRIVVYLTSQKPLSSNGTLTAGTLSLGGSFSMPASATVTLLGHELKVLEDANAAVIAAEGPGQSGAGEDDSDDEPDTYRVRVSSSRNGTVKANTTWAEARQVVTLTVSPQEGYGLNKLTVTSARGKEMSLTDMGGGTFSFRMPTADVEITAAFLPAGQNHPVMSFADVTEWDWYHSAVHYVYENGMMSGTTDTAFSPDMETTRGMIVTVLHRMEGTPQAGVSGFSDVPRSEYYAQAVDWAYEQKIVSGYGGNESGTFGPANSITREQLASILYRYAQKKGMDMTVRGDLSVFSDEQAISDYARDSVGWAVGVGLISGMGDGTISPGGTATRAQVATILMRYCQNIAD